MSGLVLTVCALMRMRSIPQNLSNYCLLLWPENEASLDARLLTNVNIEGGRGYRPGLRPFYVAIETQGLQTLMVFVHVYLLRVFLPTSLSLALPPSLPFR